MGTGSGGQRRGGGPRLALEECPRRGSRSALEKHETPRVWSANQAGAFERLVSTLPFRDRVGDGHGVGGLCRHQDPVPLDQPYVVRGGVFGSLVSTPILNPPQSAILGMHTIQQRPVAVDGEVVIRPMMYLALSYDHRIVDGKEAVQFLVTIKNNVEDPTRLLLDLK